MPQAYVQREQFRKKLAHFLESDSEGDVAEAEVLAAAVDKYLQAREITAAEALSLKIAFIRKTGLAQSVQEAKLAELLVEAEQQGRRAELSQSASVAPEFTRYKASEAAIVESFRESGELDVESADTEALRQALLEARIAAYKASSTETGVVD